MVNLQNSWRLFAWDRKGKGAPTTYYHVKGEIISQITFNKSRNLYYTCKGLQIYPQPHPYEILIVKRYYLKLKADNNYGRRITRILEAPQSLISNIQYAVVEYKGLFPGHNSHGLSKTTDSIYLRTPSYVMDKIEELSKHNLTRTVYGAISTTKDETSISNMKQICNTEYYRAKKELEPTHVSNIVDQFQFINELAINEPMKGSEFRTELWCDHIQWFQLYDIERLKI